MAVTEPMSIRLSPEMKNLFQEAARQSGLKQEDFITTLLNAYHEAQAQEAGAVTVSQEKRQIRAGLSQIQVLIEAVIDRAGNQELQAAEMVDRIKQEYSEKSKSLNQQLAEQSNRLARLETENQRLKENEESRGALKQAFAEKEEAWAVKRRGLETRAAELNEKLAAISNENIELRKMVDDIKTQLTLSRKALEEARNDHQLKLKDVEIENQNAVSQLRLKLSQENEERLKTVIESERMAADKRVQEIVALIGTPEKKAGKKKNKTAAGD